MAPEVHFDDNAQHAGADATIHRSQPCWSVSPMSALPCHPGQTMILELPGWLTSTRMIFKQQDMMLPREPPTPLSENEASRHSQNSQCDGHGKIGFMMVPLPGISHRRLGWRFPMSRINRSHVSPQTDKVWSHFSHTASSGRANAVSKWHNSISRALPTAGLREHAEVSRQILRHSRLSRSVRCQLRNNIGVDPNFNVFTPS